MNNVNEENNEKSREVKMAEALNAMRLLSNLDTRPKLITINDLQLYNNIENLIEKNATQLRGEYNFYCVYQKPLGSQERYALIHAFYLESDGINEKDMDRIILEDGKLMHQSLLEAKLECDYFYVMPYFDYADKTKGSILLNHRILLTNELEEFEEELIKDGLYYTK